MGRMKKSAIHEMYREDALGIVDTVAGLAGGFEGIVANGLFAVLAVDVMLVTSEIPLASVSVTPHRITQETAINPAWAFLGIGGFLIGNFGVSPQIVNEYRAQALDPKFQWVADHRIIMAKFCGLIVGWTKFEILGLKPFEWLAPMVSLFNRWEALLLEVQSFPGDPERPDVNFIALPLFDRIMMAAFIPGVAYAAIKVFANVPRLVGDLLPG